MSTIDEYQKARGHKPAHPDTKENLGDEPILNEPINDTKWVEKRPNWFQENWPMMLSVIIVSGLFSGLYYWMGSPVITKPVDNVAEKIVYKTKYVTKWKTKYKTKWKTRTVTKPVVKYKTRIKYVKDPAYDTKIAELEANHARRMAMMREFYEKPLKPGERRQLTFESSCPGFTNEKHILPAVNQY